MPPSQVYIVICLRASGSFDFNNFRADSFWPQSFKNQLFLLDQEHYDCKDVVWINTDIYFFTIKKRPFIDLSWNISPIKWSHDVSIMRILKKINRVITGPHWSRLAGEIRWALWIIKRPCTNTESCQDANYVVTGDTGGCRQNNFRFHQRRQSWQHRRKYLSTKMHLCIKS